MSYYQMFILHSFVTWLNFNFPTIEYIFTESLRHKTHMGITKQSVDLTKLQAQTGK